MDSFQCYKQKRQVVPLNLAHAVRTCRWVRFVSCQVQVVASKRGGGAVRSRRQTTASHGHWRLPPRGLLLQRHFQWVVTRRCPFSFIPRTEMRHYVSGGMSYFSHPDQIGMWGPVVQVPHPRICKVLRVSIVPIEVKVTKNGVEVGIADKKWGSNAACGPHSRKWGLTDPLDPWLRAPVHHRTLELLHACIAHCTCAVLVFYLGHCKCLYIFGLCVL